MGTRAMRVATHLSMLALMVATVGCSSIGWGRNASTSNFRARYEPDGHSFQLPFPNLQARRDEAPSADRPAYEDAPIQLTDYRSEGEIIDLPLPGQHTAYRQAMPMEEMAPIEIGGPDFGESCGPEGCGVGCADECSTDGLDLQAGGSIAPMPPVYTGPNKHQAVHAEKAQGRQLGTPSGLFGGWKKDPTPDIAYNNPRFPRELRMASHPQYVVEPPDVLRIEALTLLPTRPLVGEILVRQDGTISLGYYGQVHVAGLTILEIENKIREHLKRFVENPQVFVDVASFNSKVYYVLGQVQQQGRLPITGKETVLDAITLAGGITNFAALNKIHIARPNPGGGCDQVLWVDWRAVAFCGDTRTNYQIMPGDRIVVPGTSGFKTNVVFDNFLTPFERLGSLFGLIRFATINN